jgi:glycosyltransferase involved in cell wall biosynthesis
MQHPPLIGSICHPKKLKAKLKIFIVLVSVIVPVYNVREYIFNCVQSILDQSYSPLEIILVDNNSNDGSPDALKEIKKKHPHIQLASENKQGASAARNKGLSIAKGDYIQFLDADDLLDRDKIEYQVKLIQQSSLAPDIIHANYRKEDLNGKELKVNFDFSDPWLGLMSTRLGCTCSNLWKKSALMAVNGWNENILSSQEYDLMFRMMKMEMNSLFDNEKKTLVRQRASGNISTGNLAANWKNYCGLRIQIIQFLKEKKKVHEKHYQVLFDSLRQLYKYDKGEAKRIFKEEIPTGFQPHKSEVTSSSYLFFYNLLGFSGAEAVKSISGKN